MTQLGEMVAIGIVSDADLICPFHDPHTCSEAKNNIHRGSGSTLGSNLDSGGRDGSVVTRRHEAPYRNACAPLHEPDPDLHISEDDREIYTEPGNDNRRYPVGFAAHHLIPGKASMHRAKQIHRYIESGKVICCNLGYDVDGSENGVWLPGLHPVKGALWGGASDEVDDEEVVVQKMALTEAKPYSYAQIDGPTSGNPGAFLADNNKWRYVQAAMNFGRVGRRQFHDAHPEYSALVRDSLNDVSTVLDTLLGRGVPVSGCAKSSEHGKSTDGKNIPPWQLLRLLNNTSNWLRNKLVNRMQHPVYYTSNWCGPKAILARRARQRPLS